MSTFGWYPTGLNSGHELRGQLSAQGRRLRLRDAPLRGLPRIVYEFDSPDLRTGYMYPAMARTFRSVGTQFAAMFAYDMLQPPQPRLADALPQPRLYAAQSTERGDRGGSDASVAARAVVWRVSGEHEVRRLSG